MIGMQFCQVNKTGGPYYFVASANGLSLRPHDFYFAVLRPDGRIYSWNTKSSLQPQLTEGLYPVAKGIIATEFYTRSILGSTEYVFSSTDLPGLYHVFLLVLSSGSNPENPANWLYVASVPLIFQPVSNLP